MNNNYRCIVSCRAKSAWLPVLAGLAIAIPWFAHANDPKGVSAPREKTIIVGRVTESPKKHFVSLQKMAHYLAERVANPGIVAGRVVMAENADQMAHMLRDGQVDIVSETPFSALRWVDGVGAEPLAREWKKGVASYRTVFISRKSDGVTTLAGLRGRKIAFEDPGSTSAFLIPLAMLRLAGLVPVELTNVRNSVPTGKVGYAFTQREVNIVSWVARGITNAGAFSNLDWDDYARTPDKPKQVLNVFHEGRPIMRSVMLARGDLQPDVKTALKEVLFAMHEDPEGRKVLKAYNKVKKYDPIGSDATANFDEVRRLMSVIERELD